MISDPRLPGLRVALDAQALIATLSEHLPECRGGLRIEDARVNDVQYTPGSAAQVLWKLRIQDPANRRTGRQLVCVKALRADEPCPPQPVELVRRYQERRARGDRQIPLATPWLHIPELALLVIAFPLDPLLPTLIQVTDPHCMREALHRAWQPRQARVRTVQTETLSYTPEARAALRLNVLAEHKRTGLPEVRRLVGKLHVSRTPERLFVGHWAVWRGAGGRGVAPPAGYVSQAQLSLQEFVDGKRLSDLAGQGSFIGLVRRAAHAIARVHSLTLPVLATRRVEKEMAVVDRWIGILSNLRPQHEARLTALGERLRRDLAARMCIKGTIHADFHLANVLSDGTGVTVIDWDQAAHGDPMVDIGRVLASLRVSSLRVHGRIDGFADAEAAFLDAYLGLTGEDESRARLFEAVSLLIAAAGPFRLQRDGWEEGAELMLDEVERVLALSSDTVRSRPSMPDDRRQVPFSDRLSWALDGTYAQALLVPLIHERHGPGVEVTECFPSDRGSNESRLHVRWLVKGFRGTERWRSTLEASGYVEHSGRGPHRRLQLAGEALAASHASALQLPRPIGHLDPLSLVVFESPTGRSFLNTLGTPAERKAVDTLALSLACLHGVAVDLGRSVSMESTIRSTARRMRRLQQHGHPGAAAADDMFRQLVQHIAGIPAATGIVPVGVRIETLLLSDHGVGAAFVEDVQNGEPLVMVADLMAQLHLVLIKRGAAPGAVLQLARTYADAAGRRQADVAAFAALSLLRLGCRSGADDRSAARAARSLHAASALLELAA
jgi:hypothetical protein